MVSVIWGIFAVIGIVTTMVVLSLAALLWLVSAQGLGALPDWIFKKSKKKRS